MTCCWQQKQVIDYFLLPSEETTNNESTMEPRVIITTKRYIFVYCISDLHADPESNKLWVIEKCKPPTCTQNTFNVLIVPGDVGSNMHRIKIVFNALVSQYDLVLFTPGNHEAWCSTNSSSNNAYDSLHKLGEVLDLADYCGVEIRPVKIISSHPQAGNNIVIIPLYSWYHTGFDNEPSLAIPMELRMPSAEEHTGYSMAENWSDFAFCRWPSALVSSPRVVDLKVNDESLATYFGHFNSAFIEKYADNADKLTDTIQNNSDGSSEHNKPNSIDMDTNSSSTFNIDPRSDFVLTFSHFVPRQELTPEKRFLLEADLTKVIGSNLLGSQIRSISPDVHLFGHTHIPIDLVLDGIRYIQWPLGYAREHQHQCRSVFENGPLLVHTSPPLPTAVDTTTEFGTEVSLSSSNHERNENTANKDLAADTPGTAGADNTSGINAFDSSTTSCCSCCQTEDMLIKLRRQMDLGRQTTWSIHYNTQPRRPENMQLASWVRIRLQQLRVSYARMQTVSTSSSSEASPALTSSSTTKVSDGRDERDMR